MRKLLLATTALISIAAAVAHPAKAQLFPGGGGGGGAGSIVITDGVTTVTATTERYTAGATVTNAGGGIADVAISGGGISGLTINYLPKATSPTTLGDSAFADMTAGSGDVTATLVEAGGLYQQAPGLVVGGSFSPGIVVTPTGTTAAAGLIEIDSFQFGSSFSFVGFGGTPNAPAATPGGATLGEIDFIGWTGSVFQNCAILNVVSDSDFSGTPNYHVNCLTHASNGWIINTDGTFSLNPGWGIGNASAALAQMQANVSTIYGGIPGLALTSANQVGLSLSGQSAYLEAVGFGDSNPVLMMGYANGLPGAPTAVDDGQFLGEIDWRYYDGSGWPAAINMYVNYYAAGGVFTIASLNGSWQMESDGNLAVNSIPVTGHDAQTAVAGAATSVQPYCAVTTEPLVAATTYTLTYNNSQCLATTTVLGVTVSCQDGVSISGVANITALSGQALITVLFAPPFTGSALFNIHAGN